jgi:hypothetical protein
MNSLLSGFSGGTFSLGWHTQELTMFVFNRSALAVLAPLALLIAVVLFSNLSTEPAAPVEAATAPAAGPTTVADNQQPGRKTGG